MRTKTILLTAALVAAGVATSMAQSNVYSLNVVGYVNLSITPGYNLIANQLDVDGIDNVNTALTNGVPDQSQLFTWNGTTFNPSITFFAGTGWLDLNNGGNPATNNVYPGTAFFLYNAGSVTNTVTLVGSVVQTTNTFHVGTGYGFYAVVPPVASDLDTNAFPAEDQMQYFTFSGGSHGTYVQGYTYFAGTGWLDLNNGGAQVFPTPAVGQGFLIYNPDAATTWTQSFTVK
jgi:hypothetical protein